MLYSKDGRGRGHVLVVVGAQYGSEGKGAIVSHIANRYNIHVRVGSSNAGHTIFFEGKTYKMQAIPCGWTNPSAFVVIGRGALVNMDILCREIVMLEKVFPKIRNRILIDKYAGILDKSFEEEEGHTNGELHQRIGSTGEGVGAARIARIKRDRRKFKFMHEVAHLYGVADMLTDTVEILNKMVDNGSNILIEGTQGCGLSLIHGPWPYVTSADTNAGQLIADCGLSPLLVDKVLLVARTMPIRVAGNSGPLKGETTWETLSDQLGRPVIEQTTVTKKTRRIGTWDEDLMRLAVEINRPTSIALTFVDYLNPEDRYRTNFDDLSNQSLYFINYLEETFKVPVSLIKTGEGNEFIIEKGDI